MLKNYLRRGIFGISTRTYVGETKLLSKSVFILRIESVLASVLPLLLQKLERELKLGNVTKDSQ